MKAKFFLITIAFFMIANVFSQTSLNNYKYVIVPKKYHFLKDQDQYQLNSLTVFLFNKYGFKALMEGENYPDDFNVNRCLALKSDVIKDPGLFKTKLTVELKDCNDKVVYASSIGESREKEYKTAYNFALRDAFESFGALNYKYEPSKKLNANPTTGEARNNVSDEIQQLKQELQELKNEKQATVVEVENTTNMPLVKSEAKKIETIKEQVIEGTSNILYAQEIENGFQLVDSSPKVVYRIKKTNLNDVYLVENSSAVIYKMNAVWVVEYYDANTLKQEELTIKF